MNCFAASLLCLLLPGQAPDVAVVCPHEFRPALAPWVAHRTAQGHRIALVDTQSSAPAVRESIRALAALGKLQSVVLVGDVSDQQPSARTVPAHFAEAKVNIRWGSEPLIATDNWYADLDDDHVPDLAIGRLTADTPAELSQIVTKILAYERATDFGLWRRKINFIAGVGGFGGWTDAVLEMTTRKMLADGIPPAYGTTMTYASWRSPFCPDPRAFASVTQSRLNEGCLFWVYLGHGHRQTLDWMQVPGGQHRIFDVRDVPRLGCASGAPIALMMACYTGAFDGERDCLAEEILRQPGAPVAVIAGSRVTMPYAMSVLGDGLLEQCFVRRRATIGEALLEAKRQMVSELPVKGANRAAIDALAKLLSPVPQALGAERSEHLHLFNLLGDPLLRLRHPQTAKVTAPREVTAGQSLAVEIDSPFEGECTLELVTRRDRLRFNPPARSAYDPEGTELAAMQTVYQQANDPRYVSRQVRLSAGNQRVELTVPDDARGACHVRVFVAGQSDFALGACDVDVRRPRAAAAQ